MTMYHMTMPPHVGSPHPPTVHSSLFQPPILPPPMGHTYPLHSFPPTPHPPHHPNPPPSSSIVPSNLSMISGGNSALLSHPTPMLSQPSPLFQPPTSVYVNPYHNPPMAHSHAHAHPHPHPSHPHPSHPNPAGIGYGPPALPVGPAQGVGASGPTHGNVPPRMGSNQGPVVLSVDEELLEEMHTLHLGYLETDDSPQKLEQREKLERVIMEYLAITPHSHKFMFHQVCEVLERSVNSVSGFNAYQAACAFDALAQYAANLLAHPWRTEYTQIKLYSGFWVHQVANQLVGAESVLALMGYVPIPLDSAAGPSAHNQPAKMLLEGVIDPDLISRLALDCLIAYCECQVLKKISESVKEFGLSWRQILQFRQLHVGGVDVTSRHLLFTLRQRLQPMPSEQQQKQPSTSSSTVCAVTRHSNLAASTAATPTTSFPSLYNPPAVAPSLPERSLPEPRGSSSAHPPCPPPHSSVGSSHSSHVGSIGPSAMSGSHQPSAPYSRSLDTTDADGLRNTNSQTLHVGGPVAPYSPKSASSVGGGSSQVPTAKLIDLDPSHEASPSPRTSQLLPKVLPHKRNTKVSSSSSGARGSALPPPSTELRQQPPPPLPPEVFQAGTLDEHLEATLSLVKDSNRNSANLTSGGGGEAGGSSWETWDFVFRGLKNQGYNKDIGDRGDILHHLGTRQNLYTEPVSSGKNNNNNNNNITLNNKRQDSSTKPKTMSINQALQQLSLNETRERVERLPSSSKSSSHSHGGDGFPHLTMRNSLYDNVSVGFETAPQDSDDYEDRKLLPKRNNTKLENKLDKNLGCSSLSSNRSVSSRGSHGRQEPHQPSEASRSSVATPSTIQHSSSKTVTQPASPTATQPPAPLPPYEFDEKPWPCATCTYINERSKSACEMCGKSRRPGAEMRPLVSGGRQCPQCTLINERDAHECSACGVHLEGSSTYI
ncbi:PUB and ZnF_RBZ domain-containing protein tamozhennic isoform X2 [Oratosquilla oratoria]